MKDLPAGWRAPRLADVLVKQDNNKPLRQGWSPQCLPHASPDSDSWAVLKTTAVQAGRFLEDENKQLPDHLEPRPQLEVRSGDLLLTCAGPRARCGVPALVRTTRPRLMLSGKMYRFRPIPGLSPEFLELWLLSSEAQRRIDSMKTGISDSGLNLTHERFGELPVPMPPLDEQRRIVSILEEHLTSLDAVSESLRLAARRIDVLRRSSLDDAFGLGDQLSVPLRELVASVSAGKSFGSSEAPAGPLEWGIIRVSAMTKGVFAENENKAVPPDRVDPQHVIRPGDLLVSRANTSQYVGASVLVPATVRARLLLSDKSLRLVPNDHVAGEWLWRALQAPSARRQMSAVATGTKDSMRNISQPALLGVRLPNRDRAQQELDAKTFRDLDAQLMRQSALIEEIRRRSGALRNALLAAAFSGRLTGRASDSDVIETLADQEAS